MSSSGLTGATTSAIDVVPVVPTQLVVTTEPPRPVTAGSGFSLVVAAEDSSGHIATTFSDSVTVAISNNPGGSSLGGTLTVTAQNGVATFSDLTLNKVGNNYSLIVSASGVADGTTSGFMSRPRPPPNWSDLAAAHPGLNRNPLRPGRRGSRSLRKCRYHFGGGVTVGS